MSLQNPDKRERAWMDAITRFGCLPCYLMGYPGTPAAVHHITRGGRRISHYHTIPLCDPGHHKNPQKGSEKVAVHPNKARFVAEYGTELELLATMQKIIEGAP